MAKLTLFYKAMSPPCRAVLITANLLGLELDRIHVDTEAGDHLKPEFVKLNPQHTIPMLRDGDDIAIVDSHSICTYLVEKYGAAQQHLYPKDLVQRAAVDARLHLDSGVIFARLLMLIGPVFYDGATKLEPKHIEYVQRAWPLLEAILAANSGQKYLVGEQLTLGDVACIASVNSLDQLAPIDAAKYPLLVQWIKRMLEELPQYERDCGEGGVQLQAYVQSKLE